MPNNEDYVEENYEGDYQDEQDGQHEPETVPASEFKKLQEQIAMLQQSITAKSKPVKEESKELELSEEQYAAIAQDPKLLGQFVKAHLQKTTASIKTEQQKVHFDKMAEERFPALKTNKELQTKVSQKMHELVEVTGEYRWDSPTLLLRASEMVAPTMGGVIEVNKRRSDSSGEALDASTTSVHRSRPTRTKVAENDPRLQFAKAFGINDPKKLQSFKDSLGPYQQPQRRRGRSLMK